MNIRIHSKGVNLGQREFTKSLLNYIRPWENLLQEGPVLESQSSVLVFIIVEEA